jgi:hypothetical protein
MKPYRKLRDGGKMGFGLWGWPDHPQGPGGGFGHPLRLVGGVRSHPQALGGGPATPKGQNPFFRFLFFWPSGVAGPPPKAWGGFSHPHTVGMGWLATPISSFLLLLLLLLLLFFFFFFFKFPSSFQKKKKKLKLKPKIPKTTPFWAKQRRFGLAQNGVVLE